MPINILLTFVVGSAFGWVIIQITKAPHQIRGLILGCCAAGNLGNMLIITIPATCKEKGSPFGDPDICDKYALAYASLSMAIGAIILWSYVYNIVRISSRQPEEKQNTNDQVSKLESAVDCTKIVPGNCTYVKDIETHSALVICKDDSEITQPLFARSISEKKVSLLQKMQSVINFRNLFAPSTIGVIFGFIVGLIAPIRNALIGESAPLRVIQDSVSLISDGAIPSLTLILGGNLLKGLRGSSIRASAVIGVIVVRYVLLPLAGIVIVKGAVFLGLVHADPLYQFVLMVQYAVPPAMNIGTMTQLFGAGESECSVLFLWTYAFASVAVTFWSTYFMWLVS
ncbi:protein PIN-LIKES 3-like isoform X1 [Phalaenopsis equestris]|nr:protein PIN-LIKES 3-like isoform X1 [Phalaenopsis equestris]